MEDHKWMDVRWEDLPLLRDIKGEKDRQRLLIHKLRLCEERMDFTDPSLDFNKKELKRRTLVELVDHVNSDEGAFTPEVYKPVVDMVSANIFRALTQSNSEDDLNDQEDDDPALEPAWEHISIVYELFRRFIVSHEIDPKIAREYIGEDFILQLLDLFDSEDPREREYLKTILHRLYGKIMPLRHFIRRSITYLFHRYVYEIQHFNGVAELLEILGSVINGFALPLKEEHKQFLRKSLVPLHIPRAYPTYHVQLSFCVTQFVEKDASLAVDVIHGLCKYWPASHSRKEVMFLNELEELLELVDPEEVSAILRPLFRKIAACIESQHFQVAERALFLWNNEYLVNLIVYNRNVVVPIVFPALQRNARGHWNRNVHSLSFNVQKLLAEMDPELFEECLIDYDRQQKAREDDRWRSEDAWMETERRAKMSRASTAPNGAREDSTPMTTTTTTTTITTTTTTTKTNADEEGEGKHDRSSPVNALGTKLGELQTSKPDSQKHCVHPDGNLYINEDGCRDR